MNTSTNYTEHIDIMKNLKMNDDFIKVREPYKENFETIYDKANSKNIDVPDAKAFLNSLSSEEMKTLQHYSGLADEINIGNLSDEGAYNLLVHHYEKYDFNNDGIIEDGISKTSHLIPKSLKNDEKKAMVETFNSMDFKSIMSISILTIPLIYENGEIKQSNQAIDLEFIKNRVEEILNPKNPSSSRFKETIKTFWDVFTLNHKKILEEKAYYNIK